MDGIIVIDKPKAYTSHDIVAMVKKKLGEKVGHTGTLDPNATGVLPLLVGKGTKLSAYLMEHDKTYEVVLKLGEKTDTEDCEGKVIETKAVSAEIWEEEQIQKILHTFLGKQIQTPPIYSAIKVQGKKLYEYARSGKSVEIPKREIEIYAIELKKENPEENTITFTVHCSKGTYIRSLCENIAEKMGTVGYMKELRRKTVGRFTLQDAISFETFEKMSKEEIQERIIGAEEIFAEIPKIELSKRLLPLFFNGVKLSGKELGQEELEDGLYRIYGKNTFIGLGVAKDNTLKRDWVQQENVDD